MKKLSMRNPMKIPDISNEKIAESLVAYFRYFFVESGRCLATEAKLYKIILTVLEKNNSTLTDVLVRLSNGGESSQK